MGEQVFGFEMGFVVDGVAAQWPTDMLRIQELDRLIDSGWIEQIVISQDICMKCRKYGGWGLCAYFGRASATVSCCWNRIERVENADGEKSTPTTHFCIELRRQSFGAANRDANTFSFPA
jgi:hypothetical protein